MPRTPDLGPRDAAGPQYEAGSGARPRVAGNGYATRVAVGARAADETFVDEACLEGRQARDALEVRQYLRFHRSGTKRFHPISEKNTRAIDRLAAEMHGLANQAHIEHRVGDAALPAEEGDEDSHQLFVSRGSRA